MDILQNKIKFKGRENFKAISWLFKFRIYGMKFLSSSFSDFPRTVEIVLMMIL